MTLHRTGVLAAVTIFSLLGASMAWAAETYPHTSFGVPFSTDEDWYKQCMRVENRGVTEAAAPAAKPDCKASDLYYTKLNQAKTSPAEWRAVRACAIASKDSTVLMMLYANGFGVPRDTDVALHYACTLEFAAKAEMEARVEHLTSAKHGEQPFDQCDDITSGHMGAICASIREDRDRRVRENRLDRLGKTLTPTGRAALAKLRAAAERYGHEGVGEVDMQGTAAPALSLEHQARLREEFMQTVFDAVTGKLPAASDSDYAAQDATLNDVYQTVMAIPSTQADWPDRVGSSTIAHADVRKTERVWLAYRDAFVAFAAQVPAAPDAFAMKTWLARQRVAQLARVERYR